MAKDTIYLETDDEITSVIDRLETSPQSVVAFVLPKRTTVFQSIVNMRLLQKAAKKVKKSVVLITSDEAVLGVAALAKLHVAKSLHSKPVVPTIPKVKVDETPIDIDKTDIKSSTATLKNSTSNGEGTSALANQKEDSIELDNRETAPVVAKSAIAKKSKRKLKIPDFGGFRVKLFLGILLLILLIFGSVMAFYVLPKAVITITTNSSNFEVIANFTASTDIEEFDEEDGRVPAILVETTETDTQTVATTGEKNVGERATGQVRFYNCNRDDKVEETVRTIPAGSTISSGGFNFITQSSATVEPSKFSGNTCQFDKSSGLVDVEAVEPGDNFNLAPRSYSVSGYATITARDEDGMSGGTNNIVKVVQQSDIDSARDQLTGRSQVTAISELEEMLAEAELFAITETLVQAEPSIRANPAVDTEADEVTVTAQIRYTMLGVSQGTLEEILNKIIEERSEEDQLLQDNGFESAIFRVVNQTSEGIQQISMETVASVGPNIDEQRLAEESAGKRRGDIQSDIRRLRGVTDVRVDYSPFWVLQTPNRASRIFIELDQAN